jgi:hypothetical protein
LSGKYVTIFVPADVKNTIGSKPSILVEYFNSNSELIDIIRKKEEENDRYRDKMKEIIKKAKKMQKELRKIYSNESMRKKFKIDFKEQQFEISKEPFIRDGRENKKNELLILNRDNFKVLEQKTLAHIDMLRGELVKCFDTLKTVRNKLISLTMRPDNKTAKEMDFTETKLVIREIKALCWNTCDKMELFNLNEERNFNDLKKRNTDYEKKLSKIIE